MEIHSRYLERIPVITTNTTATNSPEEYSDKMFQMIRGNCVKELLDFFKALPPGHHYSLVNARNVNYDNMLPINYAIKCSVSHLIIIMLLRLGARFDNSTESPIFLAIRAGLMNFVKILMISGADVNALDKDGYSILHWACFKRNILMVRLILKLTDFTFQNHDRNVKRISPLGIAIDIKNFELVKELLKCPKVDPNIIDTKSQRYIYDLAAESHQYHACIELESAFRRSNKSKYTCELSFKKAFHDLHEYTVEMVIQHQLRSTLFTFHDDPRGAYETYLDRNLKLPLLPDQNNWIVVKGIGTNNSSEGWKYGYLTNERNEPLAVNYSGKRVVVGGPIFAFIDNYRYRLLARVQKNSLK